MDLGSGRVLGLGFGGFLRGVKCIVTVLGREPEGTLKPKPSSPFKFTSA